MPGGVARVVRVECSKLAAQSRTAAVLAVCLIGPFAFVAAVKMQTALPEDTLFGREMKESGLAAPLVVLGFAALWLLPALSSIVGGDLFSAEDRYGTWPTVLARSRTRGEMFAGKLLVAAGFPVLAILALAIGSGAAGALLIGTQPLIDLSGALLPPATAGIRVAYAWLSVLPPALAFSALAVLISVATRSSAAGIGGPVVLGLAMQLVALVDGPDAPRRLLVTCSFGSWHGLLSEHPYYAPLIAGTAVSALYFIACAAAAYGLLRRRDIGG